MDLLAVNSNVIDTPAPVSGKGAPVSGLIGLRGDRGLGMAGVTSDRTKDEEKNTTHYRKKTFVYILY